MKCIIFCVADKEEAVNIQSLIKSKPKFCRHCDNVVLNSGIRKKTSEMPFLNRDEYVSSWKMELLNYGKKIFKL